jgi:hypothetical protein
MAVCEQRGGSPCSDAGSRCVKVTFFEGCTCTGKGDIARPESSGDGFRSVSRVGATSIGPMWARFFGASVGLDVPARRPLVKEAEPRGSKTVSLSRVSGNGDFDGRCRAKRASHASVERAGELETVQTLSGWGATFPERSWSLNRRGVENTRGWQSIGSTWRWPVLGECL